jgi:O-antigen ligase
MPSVQQKVAYFLLDRAKYIENGGSDFSDAERWGSILVGLYVGNKSPWYGCGYGDLWYEIERGYALVFPQDCEPKIPHNQWIMFYAGLGIIGVLVGLFAFLFPILYRKNYRDWYFLALHILMFISFMVEATIETQVGTAIYSFFLGLGLNYLKKS